MQMPLPLTKDLVLIGGGHTHALVLRKWGMAPLAGTRLTVIDPNFAAAYSGMLPGHIAGHYSREDLDIDLVRLARFAGARLILGAARHIDPRAKTVSVEGRPDIPFDVASVDIGITSRMPQLPGFAEYGVPAKPLGPFAQQWEAFVARLQAGRCPPHVVVLGAGVAGAELSMAMAWRISQDTPGKADVTLIDTTQALSEVAPRTRAELRAQLTALNVKVIENAGSLRLGAKAVLRDGHPDIPFGFCTGAAGARPHPWLENSGLQLHDGFICVDPELRSPSHPDVFAVGDCAHMQDSPRPKAGVYAVRQAPILLHNLEAVLSGGTCKPYRPQNGYLKLISQGKKSAIAEKGPFVFSGPRLWQLKDRIDQKFMDKFRNLPAMPAPPLPARLSEGVRQEVEGSAPLCGGCGAKVGAQTLRAGIAAPGITRSDVLSHPGDDAAVLQIGTARQVITTDHLRAFSEDPWLMARIALIHALGDIWAMGATPQAVLSNITLPNMSEKLQQATLREITDGAASIAGPAGAALVGGHTTLGAELTIGFTVTGLVTKHLCGLNGARAGDALILTKPLGSGVLLAAEMRMAARGAWIANLFEALQQSQADAATLLAPHARAMTDVTGFGLAGHLLGILSASNVAATLTPQNIRAYDGARAVLSSGVRSSLHPANLAAVQPYLGDFPVGVSDLLCDPQTSGGLLAAVPADTAPQLLLDLERKGYDSACIGTLTQGPVRITCA